ncbi:MAG: head-tail adaptor protein [Rhodospirillales bacterium]|nr:head-tail adaptor protein [Rhodospirillales bacterium]
MAFVTPGAGDLRARIALLRRTQAPTAGGGLADSYTTLSTVRARVRSLFGTRLVEGAQTTERATHVITIRARADTEAWRYVEWCGARYRVHTVMSQGNRHQWQELMVEALGEAD